MSDKRHVHSFTAIVRRDLRKRVPLADGRPGFTTIDDGTEEGDALLEVDVAAILAWYGPKALGNKARRATAMHGAIKVTVTKARRVEQ